MNTCMYFVLFSVFTLNSGSYFLHSVEASDIVIDCYWRDYHGLVPSDAIGAGKNLDGEETFVGQIQMLAEYNSEASKIHTIPVSISYGNRTAIGTYNGRTITSNEGYDLKILCSQRESYYKWHTRNSPLSSNCRYVVVGVEDLVPLYVGNTEYNKEIITGKIFSDSSRHYGGLIIPKEGGEYFPAVYKILTYCY